MMSRMIHTSVSRSKKIASLSAESQILFMMLIPHFSSHGKMYGGTGFIKDVVCPLIKSLTPAKIDKCLNEISSKTNVKRYSVGGIVYLQSLSWGKHQKLRQDRLGKDLIPSYSGVTPDLLPPEVEVEVEVKEEVEGKEKKEIKTNTEETVRLFNSFWQAYPRKENKKKAKELFLKLDLSNGLFEKVMAGLEKQIKTEKWRKDDGQYIPLPTTWINGNRWEDEVGAIINKGVQFVC